jgi:polar amino acid transport system substrate-binding protein
MRKKLGIRRLSILLFFMASFLLTTGCVTGDRKSSEPVAIPPDINILRVGVTPNAPPLIFKQANEIVGLEADFARELAKYLDKTLRFVELKWEDQIPALLENRIDIIMSGMTRTALREVRISFTNRYLESGQMALIRREDAARFSTGIFSLSTSSAIGVIENTFGEYFVDERYSSVERKHSQHRRLPSRP